jgi:cytochrome c oxidase subunit 2
MHDLLCGMLKRSTRPSSLMPVALALLTSLLAVMAGACSSSTSSSPLRSPLQTAALRIMVANGCASCHGTTGQGGVGPSWIGLFGSTVRLADGSTTTADESYLSRSITDPSAQLVAGYTVSMPLNRLGPTDLATMLQFIASLSSTTPAVTATP